jgi:hypothetical protein
VSPKLSSRHSFLIVPEALSLGAGRLVPALLAAILALVVLSGFLPLRWFPFQDYEMARQVLQWDAPFIPNLHMRTSYFEGGEAQAGNLPSTEPLGLRTFSTDRFGFRYCPPVAPGQPTRLVVFRGFSFIFGVGLGDEQTFPAALARHTGRNAYNAARFHEDPETPEDFDDLMAKTGVSPETVVYVHLEPNDFVLSPATEHRNERRRAVRFAKEFPLNWVRLSPVILTAMETKKAVENDVILHNRYRENVRSFPLPGGARMLVRAGDLERVQTEFPDSVVADRSDYIAWWNRRIVERGARMVVLLVPEKMSVYGPSLGVKLPADPLLNRMERNLAARGVRVVNGLPLLRATAAADLSTGKLAYLREDEHWNADGVERLAKAVADAIRRDEVSRAIESSKVR